MKGRILFILTVSITITFLQADSLPSKALTALQRMKSALNCIDSCWATTESPVQLLTCMGKCPKEKACSGSKEFENRIACSTDKTIDNIFKCQAANPKNRKNAKEVCSAKAIKEYLTKNVNEFEQNMSEIGDSIDDLMEYSSFASNANYSQEVQNASTSDFDADTHSTQSNSQRNKTYSEWVNKKQAYESTENYNVNVMNNNYSAQEQARQEREAERDKQRILRDIAREKSQQSTSDNESSNECALKYSKCIGSPPAVPCSQLTWDSVINECDDRYIPPGNHPADALNRILPNHCCGR